MSTKTSMDRGRQNRREAAAIAALAQRRRRQRIGAVAVVAVVVLLLVFLATRSDKKSTTQTATSTTVAGSPTSAATGSAAGKPCVAVADPLPTGAPEVPVQVGPPPTQLVVQDLKEGDGAVIAASSTVTVNYIGVSCSTGKIFDSSYQRGQTASFPLAQVIPGWTQGLPGMKVGGSRLLGIPPDLGYGAQGNPPVIAPDETLWFVVDVVSAT